MDTQERLTETKISRSAAAPITRFRAPESALNQIKIAEPCSASWEQMQGNDRVRFCDQCQLNVYNLSGMDKTDAQHLVVETEGRLCVRFYQRFDGTVLTRDCPVGVRVARRRLARALAFTAMLLLSLVAIALRQGRPTNLPSSVQRIVDTIDPPLSAMPQSAGEPAMGKRAAPAQAPQVYMGEMIRREPQPKSGITHPTTWEPSD